MTKEDFEEFCNKYTFYIPDAHVSFDILFIKYGIIDANEYRYIRAEQCIKSFEYVVEKQSEQLTSYVNKQILENLKQRKIIWI